MNKKVKKTQKARRARKPRKAVAPKPKTVSIWEVFIKLFGLAVRLKEIWTQEPTEAQIISLRKKYPHSQIEINKVTKEA